MEELKLKIKNDISDRSSHHSNLSQLGKEIYSLNEEINQSQIAYWRKDQFRGELDKIKKLLIDLEKENKAQLLTASLEECKSLVELNKEAKFIVREFKVAGEAKSLNEILKVLRQNLPDTSILIYSVDDTNKKVVFLSSVPDVRYFS